MRTLNILLLSGLLLLSGCTLMDPDEKEIKEMLKTFVFAMEKGDEDMARICLMDVDAFRELNPDIGARVDAESFTATVLAELFHSFRALRTHVEGKSVKLKDFTLGSPWYQYKGRKAFKDNTMVIDVDGEDVEIPLKGIVVIKDKWRIVDLSGIDFIQ